MPTAMSAYDKLDLAINKIGDMKDRLDQLTGRMDAADRRLARADSEQTERITRQQAVHSAADAQACREHQARADAVLRNFGEAAPMAIAGEDPRNYRLRLARAVQKKLDPDSELARIRLGGVGDTFEIFEQKIFADAQREAVKPSLNNLPENGMIERVIIDPQNGHKQIKFYGRRTFLDDIKPTAQYVTRFNLPERH